MLLRIFKGYQAYLLILIPLLGLLLWLNTFVSKEIPTNEDYIYMPLSRIIYNIFGYHTLMSKLLGLFLLLLNGMLLTQMNIRYNFIRVRTYLPAVIYIILLSFIPDIQRLTPSLLASVFIILAINKFMETFKKDKLAIQIMDASLFISVASLFYFPALFLFIYLWIGLLIMRPFRWREWVFTVLGMTIPYIIYASIVYLANNSMDIPYKFLFQSPYINNWKVIDSPVYTIFFAYASLLIILSSFQMLRLFGTKKIHSRRFFIFFLWLFIMTVIIYFSLNSASIEIFYINAISLSFLFAHYFVNLKSGWIPELIFLILTGIVITGKFIL